MGKRAEVRREGFVFVEGALWKAESNDQLEKGDRVEIVAVNGLILQVKKTI